MDLKKTDADKFATTLIVGAVSKNVKLKKFVHYNGASIGENLYVTLVPHLRKRYREPKIIE